MNPIAQDILMHYGVSKTDGAPVGSGRYPLGSGENPNQRFHDFRGRVQQLKSEGLSEKEIVTALGLKSTTELRNQERVARMIVRNEKAMTAQQMRDEGKTLDEIATAMGLKNDSSVRALLNTGAAERANRARVTADYLKAIVDEKGMVDVGAGVESELGGISREKLETALTILEMEGYPVYGGRVPQVTDPNRQTTLKVLCPPGTEHKDIYNYGDIHSVKDYEKILTDNGRAVRPAFVYPESMDSKRLQIVYNEQGGVNKDGVIELRRGVKDLNLGEGVNYAQVRILVDGDRYLKGMAVYADDLPDGIDVRFNTNKHEGTPMRDVLKKIDTKDPNNPFGSLIKERGGQAYYDDPDGKYTDPVTGNKQSLSLINKRAEEGDWGEWSKELPSQFLSKQPVKMAQQQLRLAEADKAQEFEAISSITVPEVRKKLLEDFADNCDSAAVHLKAAAYPGQKYQVILPLTSVKDTEVYAPNFKDGSQVALIRFPHGGTFEIPILKVNNKNQEGRRVLSNTPQDAVGISKAVADRLSGADFDGDTVLVIPLSDRVKVNSTPELKGLVGFDPKEEYGGRPEGSFKVMNEAYKQKQMGVVSNLITDMTLKGATPDELARAVRHSMVVIDAAKHKLDYQASERDNNIEELKRLYQMQPDGHYGGAATLISRAKSEQRVDKRQGSARIDPETGKKIWKPSDRLYYTDYKTGEVKKRTQSSTKMAEVDDARELISDMDTVMENAYADYANFLMSMGNEARKLALITPASAFSRAAADSYAPEVEAIKAKLNLAKMNAPRERQAQLAAASRAMAIQADNPHMTKEEIRKAKQRALTSARERFGARRQPVVFTDREWEAILAGAIGHSRLEEIIRYADADTLRERTSPRPTMELTPAKKARIKAMKDSGYSTADIAEAVGVSTSTVARELSGRSGN